MMIQEKGRVTSLWLQTVALLWKNVLLKWRRKWHTSLEWLQHLAFVFLLFILTFVLGDKSMDEMAPATYYGLVNDLNITHEVIYYRQESAATHRIMEKVMESGRIPGLTIEGFSSETEMQKNLSEDTIMVTFENEFTYSIGYQKYNIPTANDYLVDKDFCHDDYRCSPLLYWSNGFLMLQAAIDAAIIEVNTNHSVWDILLSTEVVKMRFGSGILRSILLIGIFILSMCMCYISLSYLLTLYIAKERKEKREIMKIMGLRDLAF